MDGAPLPPPPPSTGSKALDAALAQFASEEHQQYLREREARLSKRTPVKGIGFTDFRMRAAYGTYWGKP
ncbi:protein of unknown function [Hyphomicrobium sp. 1Nfss2.1]|uniref:hypothetical protein n=1 Tax=Hyphomicrobium sp. 1Nfss2.1 TaxID=3413936 RepID=UPI003C7E3488